jgi:GNAT superfamily N-acetyltransferase
MKIEIRKATGRDLPSILDLYTHLGMDDGSILTLKEAKRIFNRMKTYPDYKLYIALMDKEIIGTFALIIMDNLGHRGAPSGIIEDVVVHPEWRRKGVGKRMMQFAMEQCKERDCYKMTLSSNIKREDAHRFYESLGFKKHGYSFIVEFAD